MDFLLFVDKLFSNPLTIFLLWAVFGVGSVVAGILVVKKFKVKHKFRVYFLSWIFPVIIFVMSFFGNFGLIEKVKIFDIVDSKLAVIDYKSNESVSYRLNIINPSDGKRYFRSRIKYQQYIQSVENRVIYMDYKNIYIHDIDKNMIIRKVDMNYLKNKFDILKIGINSISLTQDNDFKKTTIPVTIDAKNGKRYYYFPATNYLSLEIGENITHQDLWYTRGTDLIYYSKNQKRNYFLQLKGEQDSYKVKRLYYGSDIKNNEMQFMRNNLKDSFDIKDEFLDGEFIQVYDENNIVIILSYETTDNDNFTLTALDYLDMKIVWRIHQKDLKINEWYGKKYKFDKFIAWNKNIIFNFGPHFYSIDITNGNINWYNLY